MDGEDALKRIRLHFLVLTIPIACACDLLYILGQCCKTNFITDHYGSNQTDVWCVRHLKSQQGQSFTSLITTALSMKKTQLTVSEDEQADNIFKQILRL